MKTINYVERDGTRICWEDDDVDNTYEVDTEEDWDAIDGFCSFFGIKLNEQLDDEDEE